MLNWIYTLNNDIYGLFVEYFGDPKYITTQTIAGLVNDLPFDITEAPLYRLTGGTGGTWVKLFETPNVNLLTLKISGLTDTVFVNETVPNVVVYVYNYLNEVDFEFNGLINISLSGGTISGTTTKQAINGIALFDDLIIGTTGNYVLLANSAFVTSGDTKSFEVIPQPSGGGEATKLEISGITTGQTVNRIIPTFIVNCLKDDDNIDKGYEENVTVSITSGTTMGVQISGTTTKQAINGVVIFDNLYIDTVGEFIINASSGTLTNDETLFVIERPIATKLEISGLTTLNVNSGITETFIVRALKDDNSVDETFDGLITLSSTGTTVGGIFELNATSGVTIFSGTTFIGTGNTTLNATSPYLSGDSKAITVGELPTLYSGLKVWLDASDYSSLTEVRDWYETQYDFDLNVALLGYAYSGTRLGYERNTYISPDYWSKGFIARKINNNDVGFQWLFYLPANSEMWGGLSENEELTPFSANTNYAIYNRLNTQVQAWAKGTLLGTMTIGRRFRVLRSGSTVYYQESTADAGPFTTVYSVTGATQPLYVKALHLTENTGGFQNSRIYQPRVTEWADKSGNNNHAVQTNKNFVGLYNPVGLLGKPSIEFARSGTWYYLGKPVTGTTYTVVVVNVTTTVAGTRAILFDAKSPTQAANNFVGFYNQFTSESPKVYLNNTVTTQGAPNSQPIASLATRSNNHPYGITTFTFDGTTGGTTYLRGELCTFLQPTAPSISETTAGSYGMIIGGTKTSLAAALASPYYGHISEILVYDRVLSEKELRKLEGYLAWKWDVEKTFLPSHPFRYTSPSNQKRSTPISSINDLNPTVWLDASDESTLTLDEYHARGGTIWVNECRDKSGNGNHALPDIYSNSRPKWVRELGYFDMQEGGGFTLSNDIIMKFSGMTLFAVMQGSTNVVFCSIPMNYSLTATYYKYPRAFCGFVFGTQPYIGLMNVQNYIPLYTYNNSARPRILGYSIPHMSSTFGYKIYDYDNLAIPYTTSSFTVGTENYTHYFTKSIIPNKSIGIGSSATATVGTRVNAAFRLYEFILFNRELNNTEVDQVQNYLLNKYPFMYPKDGYNVPYQSNSIKYLSHSLSSDNTVLTINYNKGLYSSAAGAALTNTSFAVPEVDYPSTSGTTAVELAAVINPRRNFQLSGGEDSIGFFVTTYGIPNGSASFKVGPRTAVSIMDGNTNYMGSSGITDSIHLQDESAGPWLPLLSTTNVSLSGAIPRMGNNGDQLVLNGLGTSSTYANNGMDGNIKTNQLPFGISFYSFQGTVVVGFSNITNINKTNFTDMIFAVQSSGAETRAIYNGVVLADTTFLINNSNKYDKITLFIDANRNCSIFINNEKQFTFPNQLPAGITIFPDFTFNNTTTTAARYQVFSFRYYDNGAISAVTTNQVEKTLFGYVDDSFIGANKYLSGVWGGNGKIYTVPYAEEDIVEINPTTLKTIRKHKLQGITAGASKFVGGVLAPNNNIYLIPVSHPFVYKYDIINNTGQTIGISYGTTAKWSGGVLAQDGKIYGMPYTSTSVLEIDPTTNTVSTWGSVAGTTKYYGGVLAPNGSIYCVPYTAGQVLKINPIAKTTALIGSALGTGNKWSGGVLAPNGKIYCMPFSSTQVLVINPATDTTALIGTGLDTASNKFYSGKIAANGKIYAPSSTSLYHLEIDTNTDTVRHFGIAALTNTSPQFAGSALAPDGSIIGIPQSGNNFSRFFNVGTQAAGDNDIPADLADLPTSAYNRYHNNL